MKQEISIDKEYIKALELAKSHYENFPVISLFIPGKLRKHVAVIYKFARIADDIADEGNDPVKVRIDKLNKIENDFIEAVSGNSNNTFYLTLNNTIKETGLTPDYFIDLLKAFKQDLIKKRYKDYEELFEYCKHSANPVGRLILELFDIRDKKAFFLSDKICTALQITNFLQDISVDIKKDRIYLPENVLRKYGVEESMLFDGMFNPSVREMIKEQVEKIDRMFIEGYGLLKYLPFRLRIQISLTINGGRTILGKIKEQDYNTLNKRPVLNNSDKLKLLFNL